jgi:predicted HAD superfamily phosphohydrolase YqeG
MFLKDFTHDQQLDVLQDARAFVGAYLKEADKELDVKGLMPGLVLDYQECLVRWRAYELTNLGERWPRKLKKVSSALLRAALTEALQ